MDSRGSQSSDNSILPFPHAAWKTNERLLNTILDNMSYGVALFDSESRLLLCNNRYISMYGLPQEASKAGLTLRDLLNHCAEGGTFVGDSKDYIARVMESIEGGKSFSDTVNLSNGRIISVAKKPIADGGWLATHEDITERQRADEQIAHMARHDALTDLPNRVPLRERLEHELKRVKRGECLAVLCLDLDQFKGVNDTLGHPIGDELLKLVADRLRGCTREPDTIARLGGDEFAIIMTQMKEGSLSRIRHAGAQTAA